MQEARLDAIREIVNIGMGEAANSLSELTNSQIRIRVPELHILDPAEVPAYLEGEMGELGVYLSQDFSGDLRGEVLLAYSRECVLTLLESLYGEPSGVPSLTGTGITVLQEIGNTIMVSCVSTMSNVLNSRLIFDLPEVTVNASHEFLEQLIHKLGEFQRCILVRNVMVMQDLDIGGYILVLFSVEDLENILARLDQELDTFRRQELYHAKTVTRCHSRADHEQRPVGRADRDRP